MWALPALRNRETRLIHAKTNIMNKLRQHNVSTELKVQEVNAMVVRTGFLKTHGRLPNAPSVFRPLNLKCRFLLSKFHVSFQIEGSPPHEVFPPSPHQKFCPSTELSLCLCSTAFTSVFCISYLSFPLPLKNRDCVSFNYFFFFFVM